MSKKMKKKHKLLDRPVLFGILVYIVGMLLASVFTSVLSWVIHADGKPLLMNVVNVIACVLPYLIFIRLAKLSLKGEYRVGLGGKNFKESLIFTVPIALYGLLCAVVSFVMGKPLTAPFIALIAGIAPGISEELGFRALSAGNMMRCWKDSGRGIYASVIVSAIIFGFMHFQNLLLLFVPGSSLDTTVFLQNVIVQVINAAAVGILAGAAYIRTHNLWGCMISHTLCDALQFLFAALETGNDGVSGTMSEVMPTGELGVTVVMDIVFVVMGLYIIRPSIQEKIRSLWSTPEDS